MTTRYPRNRIASVRLRSGLPRGYRIMPARHAARPLGTVPADSRFGSRSGGYAVLYTSPDFATAFIETVVRDRFAHRRERRVPLKKVTDRARISTQPEAEPLLLDLRGDGCTRIGAPTDTVRARNHAPGRVLAKAIQETSRNVAVQGDTDLRHHHGRPHRRFRRRDRRADVGHFEPSVQVPPNTPPLIYVFPFSACPTSAVATTTSLPPSPGIETVQDPGHLFAPCSLGVRRPTSFAHLRRG